LLLSSKDEDSEHVNSENVSQIKLDSWNFVNFQFCRELIALELTVMGTNFLFLA